MSDNIRSLRDAYKNAFEGLTQFNAKGRQAKIAIAELACELARKANLDAPTPELWVRAAETVELPCRRCVSTGQYITGTLNGVPTGPGGPCFRCNGRGVQVAADGWRNLTYDTKYAGPYV